MENKAIVVTGASGRLGERICSHLTSKNFEVVPLSRSAADPEHRLDISADVGGVLQILKKTNPVAIIHCSSVVPDRTSAPDYALNSKMVNVIGEALSQFPSKEQVHLVNLSSAAEIGRPALGTQAIDESSPCHPQGPYGESKLLQTEAALKWRSRGLQVTCARIFNVLGLPHSESQPVPSWVKQLAKIKLNLSEPILVTGNLEVERDFLDAETLVSILCQLALLPGQGLVHVGSGKATRLSEIVTALKAVSHLDFELRSDPLLLRPNEIHSVVASIKRLEKILNKEVRFDLTNILKKMFDQECAELSSHV